LKRKLSALRRPGFIDLASPGGQKNTDFIRFFFQHQVSAALKIAILIDKIVGIETQIGGHNIGFFGIQINKTLLTAAAGTPLASESGKLLDAFGIGRLLQ